MKIFKKLFCKHDCHVRTNRKKVPYNPNFTSTITHYTIETSTCKYCGKIKTREL